ncbi:MAG: 3-keto-5-aminohexanoate cleavage protein [Deltaproteobacteria bacterium]|nr:3-keto-5-aminohexanoate cleavage protein [Deltaproteobacteria bacterium]
MQPVIITAALVGAEVTREQTPFLPISPDEIALEAERAWQAGAAVVHLHVREADGRPSQRAELFDEALRKIRARCDVITQVSTGGALGMSVEERCGPLAVTPPPEMATLNAGSCNFGDEVFMNPRGAIEEIARRIRARGIVPEVEVYEVGMVDNALELVRAGLLKLPCHFDFVLGVRGSMAARAENLRFLAGSIPPDCHWTVAGVGRHEFPMVEEALSLGGHVRVGLEDNIYMEKGVLAKGSFELVEKAAELARARGRDVATVTEARKILGIKSI